MLPMRCIVMPSCIVSQLHAMSVRKLSAEPHSSIASSATRISAQDAQRRPRDREKYSADKHRQILYSKLKVASQRSSGPGAATTKAVDEIYNKIKEARVGMSVSAFNDLIFAAGSVGATTKALSYYTELKKTAALQPNEQTINFMFRAYANSEIDSALDRILWLKETEMPRFGVELTLPLATIYLKCLIQHCGQPDHGLKLLHEVQEKQIKPDLSLYSSVIRFFGAQGDEKRVKAIWEELCSRYSPDTRAYNTYLEALISANATASAKRILEQWAVTSTTTPAAAAPDTFTATLALKLCKRDEEVLELTNRTLREWSITPDLALIHALLAAISRRDTLAKVLLPRIYEMIREYRLVPSSHTYALLIGAFGRAKDTDTALKMYDEMREKGYRPRKATFTSLLAACMNAKPPRVERAFHALEEIQAQSIEIDDVLLGQIRRLSSYANEHTRWKNIYETVTGESATEGRASKPSASKPSTSSATSKRQ